MKNLTQWFDRVVIINCAHRPDRLERIMGHLEVTGLADISRVSVFRGVIGDYVTHPARWQGGNGAWGCLRSYQRAMEDVMHFRYPPEGDEFVGKMVLKSVLFLEDDAYFIPDAIEPLNEFMQNVPEDWGQIYLGGQHQAKAQPAYRSDEDGKHLERVDGVMLGASINRTHAWAVNTQRIEEIYRHISFMPDYYECSWPKHIDHQLELAHQRRDWPVYCPPKWIAGQDVDEQGSNIDGKKYKKRRLFD